MHEFLRKLSIYSSSLCGWFLAILMVIIFMDIVMRTIGHPILGVAELSMVIMLTTVYLGLSNCEQTHGHITVDFLHERIPPKVAHFLKVICGILCIATLVICTWSMFVNTIDSYEGDEAMAGLIPIAIWPVKGILTFGLAMYAIQTLNNLLITLSVIKPDADNK